MKQIFYVFILLLSIPSISLAEGESEADMPKPVSGIHVVDDSEISRTQPMRQQEAFQRKQMKEKGYFDSELGYTKKLTMKRLSATYEIKENKNNKDPYDTHMKESLADIKLAFKYNPIVLNKSSHRIGFAAIGGYDNGWTGIKEFFDDDEMGTCTLSLYNIDIGHGGARIGKSVVRYDVNKKPTVITTQGSANSGFMYSVSWFDNTFVHDFDCANMTYKKEITEKMIEYAKSIDTNLKKN